MKSIFLTLLLLLPLSAKLSIKTSYTTIAQLTQELAGDLAEVKALANPHFDPHFIVPRPSLIAKLRRADLLIINGAGLEMGWMKPLIDRSHNAHIQPNTQGFLDLSRTIHLTQQSQDSSRAFGDVHAQGNPHYLTDPYKLLEVASSITAKLSQLDPQNSVAYANKAAAFKQRWESFLKSFDAKMSQCQNKNVISYHNLYSYFLDRYGFKNVATIEPFAGIAPSSKHTLKVIMIMKKLQVKNILQDVYHEKKTGKFIADKTGAKVVILPHDINSVEEADSLEHLYTIYTDRLCN